LTANESQIKPREYVVCPRLKPHRAAFRLFNFAKAKSTDENGKDPSSSSHGLARAEYGEIISYAARGLFNADVQPTSAICRPVEACETAATRIAEYQKPLQRSFCSFFLRAARKRRSPFRSPKEKSAIDIYIQL